MSLGMDLGEEYEDYVIQFEAEGNNGEPMTFDEWLYDKEWEAMDDELESGMNR